MKIVKIDVFALQIPLSKPYIAATRGTPMEYGKAMSPHVVVRIHTSEDLIGVGETCLLVPAYTGATLDSVKTVIENVLTPVLLDENPLNINKLIHEMDKTIVHNGYAKGAIDMALHDIAAKAMGVPLSTLLGGRFLEKIPMSLSVGRHKTLSDTEQEIEEMLHFINAGFNIFKLKVGILTPAEDTLRVSKIRDAVGDDIDLRMDVNESWSPKITISTLKKMEPFNLTYAEQPVPRWDIEGMVKIVKAVDIPISADECLHSPNDALHLIKREAADLFTIKIVEDGGVKSSQKIATIAEANGFQCFGGCMHETSIGTAASANLISSSPIFTYGCELFGPLWLKGDIVKDPVRIENGFIEVPKKPGIGVELDEEKMMRFLQK